jgi:hypothetical protein
MIVTLGAAAPQASLVDHLRRLGCTVTRVDAGAFDVCIAYPDTVDDESAAATEWCRVWAARHDTPVRVDTTLLAA